MSVNINKSIVVRFYNVFPVAPVVVGVIMACVLIVTFLCSELVFDRYQLFWSTADQGSVLRDFRIAVIHSLLVAYAPTAYVYVIITTQGRVNELRPVLNYTDPEFKHIHGSIGWYSGWRLSLAVLVVICLVALITVETTPEYENPWNPANINPEVAWHRLLGPFMSCLGSCFFYAVCVESYRLHGITARLSALDLLDLESLKPFTQQALTNTLLILGYSAIISLFLLEEGFGSVIVGAWISMIIIALASLLLPVMGVHDRIRSDKMKELHWCRVKLKQARIRLKSQLESDSSSEYSSAETASQKGDPGSIPLADLAAYQHLIEAVREWPFDTSTVLRFTFYLLIPMGSWFGGAMVERVVDTWLG